MDHLTRSQFIMLVILVSFVTSIFTGIVIATLVTQAPSPITQTVSKVVEKTIEKVVPGANKEKECIELNEPKTVIVTQEDLLVKLVEDTSSAVVSVVASKDLPVIEQYFVNPFEEDEFLKDFFPPGFLPELEIPQYRQNGTQKQEVSGGTGFFVSEDGYVLTNKHVVADKDADYSVVMNDGTQLDVVVLARDPIQDIAILKVVMPENEAGEGDEGAEKEKMIFNHIALGNSDLIKVGQSVVAIGNTLGEFQNSVSLGIVSGLDRSLVASESTGGGTEQLQKIIQTDAAVNPGNSGGPLLNIKGQVIGINTAIAQGAENVGFALPINLAKKHIADIEEFGEIKYAYLGVRYLMLTPSSQKEKDLAVDYGALIIDGENGESPILEGSPAEKAGLQGGDIILEFGGVRVGQENVLSELINGSRVGQEIMLKILRDGEEQEVVVLLDEMPENL